MTPPRPASPRELEDPVGVDHGATQVAPERLEQGELSLTVGASGTFVRDAGRGSPTSECVGSLVQPSREQLQGTQMGVEQDRELGESARTATGSWFIRSRARLS